MQIVTPVSEDSNFFPKSEFFFPKPLVEVDGEPMLLQVAKNLETKLKPNRHIFVIPKHIDQEFSLGNILSLNCDTTVKIVHKNNEPNGGLCSALLAVDELDDDIPLIISNMDEIISSNLSVIIKKFEASQCDAGVILFNSSHPRWCYCKIDEDNNIDSFHEKKVVSRHAVAGFYYFRSKKIFLEAATNALIDDDTCKDKFFISAALNQILLNNRAIDYELIPNEQYSSFYSPEQLHEYELKQIDFSKKSSTSDQINLLIPAAGNGSRFAKDGWKAPKPFIDFNNKPMLEHVLDNLQTNRCKTTVIFRSDHLDNFRARYSSLKNKIDNVKTIDKVTEGTACTVLLAREYIDTEDSLLIANSDQIIDFDCESFIEDCHNRNLDGSILIFKDPEKNTKWSFAKINADGLVTEVAEKNPISDLATVGIYYFNKGSDFVKYALDMIVNNERTNNEFYTCPVYNYMIKDGLRIGVYEIPMESMHGIGTPQDLEIYINKMDYGVSKDSPNS